MNKNENTNNLNKKENFSKSDYENAINNYNAICFFKNDKELIESVKKNETRIINGTLSVIPNEISKYKSNNNIQSYNFLKIEFLRKEENFRKNSFDDNTISQICICSNVYDTSDAMVLSSNGSVNFQNRIYKYDEFSFINKVLNMFIEISLINEKAKMSIKIENGEEKIFYLPYREEFQVKISAHSCLLEESYVYNSVIKKIQ